MQLTLHNPNEASVAFFFLQNAPNVQYLRILNCCADPDDLTPIGNSWNLNLQKIAFEHLKFVLIDYCGSVTESGLLLVKLLLSAAPLLEKDENSVNYFELSDLWQFFEEWSLCGVGIDLATPNGKTTQYFVPKLSAIQLYITKELKATSSDSHNDVYNNGLADFEYFQISGSLDDEKPLVGKVNELAEDFGGLRSLKSIELSIASWMAIYWYG
ncbi:hypothetical protein LUZ63_000809 [Rhynchospora breviuscula]|uniref:Uncharacterized protein n=1 Tax=Rhynchospora breviuscula TaxID=2022672 RepID=A0A9Q0CW75_9POAL|nr:hypothetical protein LUZ63_000809 [Rhynchospora breviuscula]